MIVFCFAVPFDEDDKDKSVWFLDHDYLENMYGMFKKVNGKQLSCFEIFLVCYKYSAFVKRFIYWRKGCFVYLKSLGNCHRMLKGLKMIENLEG